MQALKTVGIVAIIMVVSGLAYQIFVKDSPLPSAPSSEPLISDNTQVTEPNTSSAPAEVEAAPLVSLDSTEENLERDERSTASFVLSYPPLAAYDIGNEPIKDDELISLVKRLNNDPALMTDLINELRAETDPKRLKRLVYILGSTGNAEVLPVATELIYSGVPSSRDTGLDLLSRIAPSNPEAITVASNLLVSETEPDVLIATMNVLAQPAGASTELRESLVTQIAPLSTHETTNVRSVSVAILARLTNDPSSAPVFYNALFDAESNVRSAGVYAFASFPYHSEEVSQKLLDMIEDPLETAEVRRGATLALTNNSPDEQIKSRIKEAGIAMRQRARENRKNTK